MMKIKKEYLNNIIDNKLIRNNISVSNLTLSQKINIHKSNNYELNSINECRLLIQYLDIKDIDLVQHYKHKLIINSF